VTRDKTYNFNRVRRVSSHHRFALGGHRDSLFCLVRLHYLPEQRLERLNKVSRIVDEKVGQKAGGHERTLAKPPGGQAEKDAEGLDQRNDARHDLALVQVGERQRRLGLCEL